MKFIGIIPARYASTRFPAKPLAILGGKPVIQRVYEQVVGVLDDAYVATDDERIEAAVKAFGLWDKEFMGCGITEFTRDSFKYGCETLEFNNSNPSLSSMVRFTNLLIKNHFDIHGLIPMGLAIDASKLNIY